MIILRHPEQLSIRHENIATEILLASLSPLLIDRFQALGTEDELDSSLHGYIVIAEPGDDDKALQTETGCPVLSDWFGDFQFGDADFAPAFDCLDDHPTCFELTYSLNDDGFTVLIFVPKLNGVNEQILSLCRESARLSQLG
jgi:hypothetical protein